MSNLPARAIQDFYPDDFAHCYGCGRLNPQGLKLKTCWDGDETVARFLPRPEHVAVPGFVYGGLIASLIDCHAMGTAAAAAERAAGSRRGARWSRCRCPRPCREPEAPDHAARAGGGTDATPAGSPPSARAGSAFPATIASTSARSTVSRSRSALASASSVARFARIKSAARSAAAAAVPIAWQSIREAINPP